MQSINILVGGCIYFFRRVFNRLISEYQLSKIANKGNGCYINGPGYFTPENITLGNNVHIGYTCTLLASDAKIIIKDNVILGRFSFLISGNHRFDVVGTPIKDVHEKRPQDDADIVIDEECWIGANVIILKGVHVGRGCVIGAGSIVTKDIPPYTIFTNKGSKPRFTPQQITEHEDKLYK